MVTKFSSLRVSPELDASEYVAGANQIDAANERVADSALDAGAAVVRAGEAIKQSGPRMAKAGNAVARLSYQYIDGYAQAAKFEKGVRELGQAMDMGGLSVEHAERLLEGMHRRLGMMANAEELAEQGYHGLATAIDNTNARLIANENAANGAALANGRLASTTRLAQSQMRNLQYQMIDIAQGIPLMFQSPTYAMLNFANQGAQISQVYGSDEGGAARGLKEAALMGGRFVAKLLPVVAVVGAGALAMAGLTHDIQEATGVQVTFGEVALASWQVFASGVADFAKPALDRLVGWTGALWDWIKPGIATAYNGIAGGFDLAWRNTVTLWDTLPSALGDATISTANAVLDALEDMINGATGLLNNFVTMANNLPGLNIGLIGKVEFGQIENQFAGAIGQLEDQLQQNYAAVATTDYAGSAFGAISDRAVANHNAPSDEEATRQADAYKSMVEAAQARIDQMGVEREALSMTTYEANLYTNTQQLMAKAANDNIALSVGQRTELEALATSMADAQLALDGLRLEMQQQGPFEQMSRQIANLDDMLARGAISWEVYARAVEQARGNALSSVTSMAGEALGMMGQIFEGSKEIAIAQAVVSAGEGIARTMGAYPFPWNMGMAALHAGVAIAQIQKIASTTTSTKSLPGGAPSAGGSASLPSGSSANNNQSAPRNVYLTVHGSPTDVYSSEQIEQIADALREARGDGMPE